MLIPYSLTKNLKKEGLSQPQAENFRGAPAQEENLVCGPLPAGELNRPWGCPPFMVVDS